MNKSENKKDNKDIEQALKRISELEKKLKDKKEKIATYKPTPYSPNNWGNSKKK